MKKLSYTQLRMLRAIRDYGDPWHGISGAAAHGGATGTLHSLRSRLHLIDYRGYWILTDAGRETLKAHGESEV